MKPLTLEEIHCETLRLYMMLDSICNQLNIDCFVIYGTLIGAVRHKGYIPWDDDFDVIMKRPDYDRFCNYCKSNDLGHYYLCNGFEDYEQGFTISRFCDLRYRYFGLDNLENPKLGLFIDIYPLDGLGNSEKDFNYVRRKKKILIKFLNLAYSKQLADFKKGVLYGIGRIGAYLYAHLRGVHYWIKKIGELKNKYDFNTSENVGVIIWDYKIRCYKKKWFEEGIVVPFENKYVKCPKCYDEILRCGYGDYMILPPLEERLAYHQYHIYRKENE